MAPTPEQIWQIMGANKSDDAISGELFQLDLAAQPIQNNSGKGGQDSLTILGVGTISSPFQQ